MARINLYARGWFSNKRIVIEDDALGFYEQQFGSDRVRRVLFDRIDSVVYWRRFPWLRAVLFCVLIGLPGAVLAGVGIYNSESISTIIGGVVLLFWLLIFLRYLWYGRSTIMVTRDGKSKGFETVVSPRRRKKFLRELDEAIEQYQSKHRDDSPAPVAVTDTAPDVVPAAAPGVSLDTTEPQANPETFAAPEQFGDLPTPELEQNRE